MTYTLLGMFSKGLHTRTAATTATTSEASRPQDRPARSASSRGTVWPSRDAPSAEAARTVPQYLPEAALSAQLMPRMMPHAS